jgi:hypothetical protein
MGESFPDYFLHDNISGDMLDRYADFVALQGFPERADRIRLDIEKSRKTKYSCTDQDTLFYPNSLPVFVEPDDEDDEGYYDDEGAEWQDLPNGYHDAYSLDILLWARFILSEPELYKKYEDFITPTED